MGASLLPWQRDALDLIHEYDPDTGLYVHPTVLILEPRQAGKTFETGALLEHRALTTRRGRCWYTAQTQSDAEQWFRDEHLPLLDGPVFAGRFKARLSQGSHQVTWPARQSIVRVFSPKRSALHGKQSDLVNLDELWAHEAAAGDELLQAIGPTQATRPGAQVIMQSAAGDEASTFLIEQLTAARRDHDNDVTDPTVALIEHGVPDDLDATDPDVAARYHPAVGHTIAPGYLHTERRRLGAAGFARAYGNVQVIPDVVGRVLPNEQWAAGELREHDARPPAGACALLYDVAHDRSDAAICAAWTHTDGRVVVALLEHHPYTGWVAGRLVELRNLLRARVVGYDAYGPGRDIARHVERAGVPLTDMATSDVIAAYESFLTRHQDRTIWHVPATPLDQALLVAGRRPIGDAFAWGRRTSSGSIAPLVAATNVAWLWESAPAPQLPSFRTR